jgi:hypothetical protein
MGTLTTPFNSDNGQDGIMFDVNNLGTGTLTFDSYEVNIDGTPTIEIYQTTTATTHIGNETNAAAWTLIGSATVTSLGADVPTPVVIPGFTLAPGESRGIYVTGTGAGAFNYTNGTLLYRQVLIQIVLVLS